MKLTVPPSALKIHSMRKAKNAVLISSMLALAAALCACGLCASFFTGYLDSGSARFDAIDEGVDADGRHYVDISGYDAMDSALVVKSLARVDRGNAAYLKVLMQLTPQDGVHGNKFSFRVYTGSGIDKIYFGSDEKLIWSRESGAVK